MNLDAVLCVKATHTGDDTVLVQILARAERALRDRSPLGLCAGHTIGGDSGARGRL